MHWKNEAGAGAGGGVVEASVEASSGVADTGFPPCGVAGITRNPVPLSAGVSVALNNSPSGGLVGRREF